MIIETKIRGGRKGHIEDIVTHPKFRKKQIGSNIIYNLLKIVKKKECYKISLVCNKSNNVFLCCLISITYSHLIERV